MRRDTFKLLVLAGIVAFAVLYGMDLSSKGIEDVNGPWVSPSPTIAKQQTSTEEEWTLPSPTPTRSTTRGKKTVSSDTSKPVDDTPYYNWDEEKFGIPRIDHKPIVDRVSGKTAEVLHDLSRNGIKIVVSIFNRVTG
jgi:hypothetical protein